MERNLILAIVLSILIMIAYSQLVEKEILPGKLARQHVDETAAPSQDLESGEAFEIPAESAPTPIEPRLEEPPPPPTAETALGEDVLVRTPLYTAVFSTYGGRLKSFTLNNYLKNKDCKCGPIDKVKALFGFSKPEYDTVDDEGEGELVQMVHAHRVKDLPLGIKMTGRPDRSGRSTRYLADLTYEANTREINLDDFSESTTLELTATGDDGIEVIERYTFNPDTYEIGMEIEVGSLSRVHEGAIFSLSWANDTRGDGKVSRYGGFAGFLAYINERLVKETQGKIKENKSYHQRVGWAGWSDNYFISAVIPEYPDIADFHVAKPEETTYRSYITYPTASFLEEDTALFRYGLYIGPKEMKALEAAGSGLEESIILGWFGFIAKPMLDCLEFFYKYTGNYGIAIIILTIVIKILFIPLTHKSQQSMKKMQKDMARIQPELKALREKFKDDPKRRQQEEMALYKAHNINPAASLGGCLPMLLQIPVFFALYRGLLSSIELRHASFGLWITDLSAKDPCYVTPIIMGALMFAQSSMTPTAGTSEQAKMMKFMPLMFVFIFLSAPSGLVIYWLMSTLLSVGQQVMTNKFLTKE
ncbi:membrane protein insertase YidC [Thermodesulfobacteriota bacterium]